ncbi:hypothetical protein HN695_06785 [Candidatus Woesearchaeota archaeon]|jgi:hypothetical protein|nr:hypothetical protein [Candidatus Woesearchaeota archaeon]MBT5271933.1 hypothetical protein [Candidatus Woesearchaeota archaeon]MBT6041045.1 hypothetical protein [Candidatus Woesearchaeota archaeon]MBT6336221.1 hypothetical protein [Candidatus Woesearchaeota archaeon]MBT7928012.1 hypothetical protein [Candidatus Woesearchaeota archaeon]
MKKRAQSAAGAAGLIALIAVFIVLYLLLMPPQERAELLGESPSSPTYSSGGKAASVTEPFTIKKTQLSTSPGRIEYLKVKSYEHPLPSVNLYTTTNANVLTKEESLYTKNGVFDYSSRNITFNVEDIEYTNNILLSANTQKASGNLRIFFNENLIYEGVANPFPAIEIKQNQLKPVNTILFEVSPVGWRFWTTNEYLLTDLKITADITDASEQASKTSFLVTDTEKFNLEEVELRFFPDCDPNSVGKLRVYINNENIFSAIPDCTQLNLIPISPDLISAGTNYVSFKTDKGYYSIYQIKVDTELKKQTYPVYYFEVDERLFIGEKEDDDENCGEVDGVCPAGCDEDLDRDCCFQENNMYWCDVVPNEEGDRCVAVTNADICDRCDSGYEDQYNDAPEACEGLCGDDGDNECPGGCEIYYDEDCCYDDNEGNYWCNDVPVYGVNNVCKHSLSQSQCDDCPSGYKSETGSYNCDADEEWDIKTLRPDFEVELVFKFLGDSERKAAHVYVNGHKFYLDTYKDEYTRVVSNFMEAGSNAVKIEPDVSSIDIIKLSVEVKPKK